MPDTPSITIIKKFTYRGQPEEWSNKYHFSGTTPTTTASWKTLADAIIVLEKAIMPSSVSFVRAYGYEAGNENAVAVIDYEASPLTPAVGTHSVAAGRQVPGDVAVTVRWYTGQLSSPGGKKVYCRKYFHGVNEDSSTPDAIESTWKSDILTYANAMIAGTLPGSVKYCGPQGAVLQTPEVSNWMTTRTLKRRGKRPPT